MNLTRADAERVATALTFYIERMRHGDPERSEFGRLIFEAGAAAMVKLTKTAATALANANLRYGYFRDNERQRSVKCSCCGQRIGVDLSIQQRLGKRDPWTPTLRAAIVTHLTTPHPDEACPHSLCKHKQAA